MKRALCWFFTTVLLLLSLTACSADLSEGEDERIWIAEAYLFRNGAGRLTVECDRAWKINPISGAATWCCLDPLCSHTAASSCPLQSQWATSTVMAGDWIYRSEEEETSRIVSYSLRDGKREVVYRAEEGKHCLLEYGKGAYLWFWEYTVRQGEDGSYDYIYSLFRADRDNGRVECLAENVKTERYEGDGSYVGSPEMIVGEYEGRLYISSEGQLFTADLDYGDRRLLSEQGSYLWNSTFHRGYLYYMSPNIPFTELKPMTNETVWGNYARESLYRMDCTSGKVEKLHDNIGGFALVEDGIYYVQAVDEPQYFNGDESTWWDFFEGNVYRMALDGSERETVCHVPNVNFYCYPSNFVFLGARRAETGEDYVAIMFFDRGDELFFGEDMYTETYPYTLSPSTLIVNTSTGEYTIAQAPDHSLRKTEVSS